MGVVVGGGGCSSGGSGGGKSNGRLELLSNKTGVIFLVHVTFHFSLFTFLA